MFIYRLLSLILPPQKQLEKGGFSIPSVHSSCSEGAVWKEDSRGIPLWLVQWLGLQAFTAKGKGSIPGSGSKIPRAGWHGQKKKQTKRPQKEGKEPVPTLLCPSASGLGSDRLIHQRAASAPSLPWPGLWDSVLDELPLNGPLAGERGL